MEIQAHVPSLARRSINTRVSPQRVCGHTRSQRSIAHKQECSDFLKLPRVSHTGRIAYVWWYTATLVREEAFYVSETL